MAINRVDITRKTVEALAEVHVAELDDGCWAFVVSIEAYFRLDKSNGTPADGINIIAPLQGSPIAGSPTARWIRQEDMDVADGSANQPAWFIDPVNGNDENSGLTALTAVKHWAEVRTRIGDTPLSAPVAVFTFMGDIPASDPVIVDFHVGPNCNIVLLIGVPKQIYPATGSTTITGVTSLNRATNTPWSIQDATIADWAASGFINSSFNQRSRRIRGTGGTIDGALCWPCKATAPTEARISPFTNALLFSQPTPLVGDAYVIEQLPQLFGFRMDIKWDRTSPPEDVPGVVIIDLETGVDDADPVTNVNFVGPFGQDPKVIFSGCQTGPIVSQSSPLQAVASHLNSRTAFYMPSDSADLTVFGSLHTSGLLVIGTTFEATGDTLFQKPQGTPGTEETRTIQSRGGARVALMDVGFFDGPPADGNNMGTFFRCVLLAHDGGVFICRRISFTGTVYGDAGTIANTPGIRVCSGSQFFYVDGLQPTIVGSTPGTNDVIVAGVEYSQAAVAAIVGGPGINPVTDPVFAAANLCAYTPEVHN